MSWLKLDDGFASHPKIVGRTDAAYRLHVNAMGYCARHRTAGVVHESALLTLYPRNPRKWALELVNADVWHAAGHDCPDCPAIGPGQYVVHDFLVYNPSNDESANARTEKARRAARARWDKQDHARMPGAMPEQCNEHMLGDAPSRPVPITNPPGGADAPPNGQASALVAGYVVDYRATHNDHEPSSDWRSAAGKASKRLLDDGETPDVLARCLGTIARENKNPSTLAHVVADYHGTRP